MSKYIDFFYGDWRVAGKFLRKKENFGLFLVESVNGVPVQKCHCPGTDKAGHKPIFNQCRYLKKFVANEN